jgi:thiopeptide-type bacteriocin biosynthesis protein
MAFATYFFRKSQQKMKETTEINDLIFSTPMLLRTPVFPYRDITHDVQSCLNLPIFRYAILIASADLYRELEKTGFDYQKLSVNSRASLWKYWNRMQYRPTPFGLFAAFSVVHWDKEQSLRVADNLKFHVWYDFKKSQQLMDELISNEDHPVHTYVANTTLYPVQNTYRHLSYEIIKEDSTRSFQINEVEADEALCDLVRHCEQPVSFKSISQRLCARFQFTVEESHKYISELIRIAILTPPANARLNITGKDYLVRKNKSSIQIDHVEELERYAGLGLYVNTERPMKHDALSIHFQEKIKEGLTCLMKLTQVPANAMLQDFKTAFSLKYDRQQVSLLKALDPGIGIGYNGKLSGHGKPSLLQNADFEVNVLSGGGNNWTPVHALLMQKWLCSADKYAPLQLDMEDIAALPADSVLLPNSFSIMFRVVNGKVILEQAGGATGTALSGRFTPMNSTIYKTIKELAEAEEQANPQVIFAEISHIENLHTGNIDRRENLYAYEISILCGSVLEPEQQIALSDLYVSVLQDEIYLWSEKLNKRVIPRLSSAYNYLRSELSVFRFLCDLQHQGLQSALQFDLQQFFPDQDFYPRVVYRDTIIQPATWVIPAHTVDIIATMPIDQRMSFLVDIAGKSQWPRYVSLNEYDHQLIFDLENADYYHLAMQIKPGKKLVIREFLIEDENNLLVSNSNNEGFINQFAATVYHNKEVYSGMRQQFQSTPVPRLFVPGSEWLYYKLYVHPTVSNKLLVQHILKCVRQLKVQGLIKKWFFVRYLDPGYHLRIRLQLTPQHTGYALTKFVKVLEQLISSGIIQQYSLDTYERELERYTPALITVCEDFFCASTALITGWLERITADDTRYDYYYICLISARTMSESFGWSEQETISLFKCLYEGMAAKLTIPNRKEHNNIMKRSYREINHELGKLNHLSESAPRLLKKEFKLFDASVKKIAGLTQSWHQEKRTQLFADLLHMHINRLLVDNSQKQEMILYYSLWRLFESEAARKNVSGLSAAADKMVVDPV